VVTVLFPLGQRSQRNLPMNYDGFCYDHDYRRNGGIGGLAVGNRAAVFLPPTVPPELVVLFTARDFRPSGFLGRRNGFAAADKRAGGPAHRLAVVACLFMP